MFNTPAWLPWCKEITQVQIQENVTALFNRNINPGGWLCRHDQNCDHNFVTAGLLIQIFPKSEHPISLDRKVVWVVSRATGDLCYMMPALLTSFKNCNIILQSWLMGFLLFFWKHFLKQLYIDMYNIRNVYSMINLCFAIRILSRYFAEDGKQWVLFPRDPQHWGSRSNIEGRGASHQVFCYTPNSK